MSSDVMYTCPIYSRLANLTLSLAFLLVICASGLAMSSFDYQRIESAIQERNFASAQQELERHLQTEPDDYRAHMLLGIVLDEQGKPAEAAGHFQKAVQLQPQSPAAHINLGKHDGRVGDLSAAAEEFESAIRLSPSDTAGHNNLGLVLMSQGKNALALAEFEKASDAAPRDAATWLNLFRCQLALRQFSEARASAKRIVSMDSSSEELRGQLGAMQAHAGDYAGAIESLSNSLSLNPHSVETRYNLGIAYYRAGNISSARETLESLRKEHESAEVESLLGEIYEKDTQYLKAVQAFQKAAEMEPSNEEYRFDFVSELLSHRNYDAALLVAQPAVHDFPSSMRLDLTLGVAHFAKGMSNEAMEDFLTTARKFPDSELPLYFLALAGDALRADLDEIRDLVRTYASRHPDQFWAYSYLGHDALQAARTSLSSDALLEAEKLLKKSIELQPSYPDSHLGLGNAYFQQKRWQEAIEEYEKAIRLNPTLTEAHYKLYLTYAQVGNAARAHGELEIHQRLQQQEAPHDLTQAQVRTFLYKLRN
jgi:tetratricopeptide (TPR) repeat protein